MDRQLICGQTEKTNNHHMLTSTIAPHQEDNIPCKAKVSTKSAVAYRLSGVSVTNNFKRTTKEKIALLPFHPEKGV